MSALAEFRWGRVLLHAYCLVLHPGRVRWHWHGIVREFAGGKDFLASLSEVF